MSFLISGFEYQKICKYSYCPRYPYKYIDTDLKEGDFVYLNLDHFNEFINVLQNNKPANKFNLITHNSDKTFSIEHLNLINNYVIKVYPINCNFINEKIQKIPIGFVDDKYKPHIKFTKLMENPPEKSILIYMNFEISTNRLERTRCFNYYSRFNWIKKESNLPPEEFYKRLAQSKYVISPEGTGIDCHRIYESIFCNAIPIVKTSGLDDFYKTLPVIIVNDWDYVTEDFLIKNYNKYYENLKKWKEDNINWCNASFWINRK
jgi:hypothetical protein